MMLWKTAGSGHLTVQCMITRCQKILSGVWLARAAECHFATSKETCCRATKPKLTLQSESSKSECVVEQLRIQHAAEQEKSRTQSVQSWSTKQLWGSPTGTWMVISILMMILLTADFAIHRRFLLDKVIFAHSQDQRQKLCTQRGSRYIYLCVGVCIYMYINACMYMYGQRENWHGQW